MASKRSSSGFSILDEVKDLNLEFKLPDYDRYPILAFVEELIHVGGNRVAVMSIANDYIVQKFLDERENVLYRNIDFTF